MILAVCPNPAVDVTYAVGQLRVGHSHRVQDVHRRAGGKGVNVARVLTAQDEPVHLLAPAGGVAGAELAETLTATGVVHTLVPIGGSTRHTVAVVADGPPSTATVLNESGPVLTPEEWAQLLLAYDDVLAGADAVVLSGSLPRGLPLDAYAQLVHRTREVPVIVDAEGEPLAAALHAHPQLAKPNAAEAAALLGVPVESPADAALACARLVDAGARSAVVSCGAAGLAAVLDGHRWTAQLPVPVQGNPTGAGDALTAGLARGLARGDEPADLLADAIALAAAAVAADTAGEAAPGMVAALRPDVVVKEH